MNLFGTVLVHGIICTYGLVDSSKFDFLADYVNQVQYPQVIEAHLCWTKEERFRLQKVLSINNRVTANLEDDNITSNLLHKMFISDVGCNFFNSLYQQALKHHSFKNPHHWLIFGNRTYMKTQNYYFPVNSHVTIVETSFDGTLILTALYKLKNNFPYLENDIAKWSNGFLYFNHLTPILNRTNFHKMPLRVSYVINNNDSLKLENLLNNRDRHIDKPSKINFLLYEYLVEIWNMSHKAVIQSEWGLDFNPIELYHTGMLGDLTHDRADTAGTVQFTPSVRAKYFKFLVSTTKDLKVFFTFRAPPLPYTNNLFALPFDGKVWMGCVVVLMCCCSTIWIILQWEKKVFETDMANNEQNFPNLLDVIMMIIAVICQVDYFHEPQSTAGKIATLSLLLGFNFIYNAFCARIVVLLQMTTSNIHDYKALYEAKMDMGVANTPYDIFYFSNPTPRTNEEWRKRIYQNKIAPNGNPKFYSAAEGINLVQSSYFAFHVEQTTASDLILSTFSKEEMCSIRMVESIYKADKPYLACPINSTFVEYLFIGFDRMFETGVFQRENRRRITKLSNCIGNRSTFVSVGFIECSFALEVFATGVFLSCFLLLIELTAHRHLKRRFQC